MVLAGLLLLEFLPSCEGLEAANDARLIGFLRKYCWYDDGKGVIGTEHCICYRNGIRIVVQSFLVTKYYHSSTKYHISLY
jgi:hypothetical protein